MKNHGCPIRSLLAVGLATGLLFGCSGGASTPPAPAGTSTVTNPPAPVGGASGSPTPSPTPVAGASSSPIPSPTPASVASNDTAFFASGRYIEEAPTSAVTTGARRFFFKGVAYSPTPIGQAFPFNSELADGNAAIWSRDLALMRAAGVNAIRVYNVTPPPNDSTTGGITNFLNAAWNNGNAPIYLLMDISFSGSALLNQTSVSSLAQQFHDLDQKYAKYPAVMGVAIGNELGNFGPSSYYLNPAWWAGFNTVAKAAKQGFVDGGDANKIVMTSEADGGIEAVQMGEANNAAVDAWGVNIYRGRTFTDLFTEIRQFTQKPVLVTEYGASAAYHPGTGSTYAFTPGPTEAPGARSGRVRPASRMSRSFP